MSSPASPNEREYVCPANGKCLGAILGTPDRTGQCLRCWRRLNRERLRADPKIFPPARYVRTRGSAPTTSLPSFPLAIRDPCTHLGKETGETVQCPSCRGTVNLKLYSCGVYGSCTLGKYVQGVACCTGTPGSGNSRTPCPGYESSVPVDEQSVNEVSYPSFAQEGTSETHTSETAQNPSEGIREAPRYLPEARIPPEVAQSPTQTNQSTTHSLLENNKYPTSRGGSGLGNGDGVRTLRWAYGVTTVPERARIGSTGVKTERRSITALRGGRPEQHRYEGSLLHRTLLSLRAAGFDRPLLFADGVPPYEVPLWEETLIGVRERGKGDVESISYRYPKIRTYGNWILGLSELFIRYPYCDRYAMFQDDFVVCKGLREYLSRCQFPDGSVVARDYYGPGGRYYREVTSQQIKDGAAFVEGGDWHGLEGYTKGFTGRGYWNLYSFPSNEDLCPMEGGNCNATPRGSQPPRKRQGWYIASGFGRGAVALVFDQRTVVDLLTSLHLAEKPTAADPKAQWKKVDGGIVTALAKVGRGRQGPVREYVHHPALIQHTGDKSSMDNLPHPVARSFKGEDWNCLELLRPASIPVH